MLFSSGWKGNPNCKINYIYGEKGREMKDIDEMARFVKSGIKDLSKQLDIDEGVLLHFILNTPTGNIDLLHSKLKDRESIKSFILNWEYVENVMDREIKEILRKC